MIAADQEVNTTVTLETNPTGQVKRTVLPGGARVITESMFGVKTASVGLWMKVGSRDEAAHEAGCSHFLEHLLFKGTRKRDVAAIVRQMDSLGGESNAFTDKECTCFHTRVRDVNLDQALDLLLDLVTNSVVAPQMVDQERGVVLEEIARAEDDPHDNVTELFLTTLLGTDHQPTAVLGRPVLGSSTSITDMQAQTVADYYRSNYTPDRLVIAVTGNVDHEQVVSFCRKGLVEAGWLDGQRCPQDPRQPLAAGQVQPLTDRATAERTTLRLAQRPFEQANVMLGVPGLHRNDPRRHALGLADVIVGRGWSSRLFRHIREQRSLAYVVYSYFWKFSDAGVVGSYAGCSPAKTPEVIEVMGQLLDEVVRDGFSDDELTRAKGQLLDSLVLGMESPAARMMRLGDAEWFNSQWRSMDERMATVAALTLDEVNEVAAQMWSQPRTLAVVGPFKDETLIIPAA